MHGCFVTEPDELARLESMLGPESARWWRGLGAFWSGRILYVRALDDDLDGDRRGPAPPTETRTKL